MNIVSNNYAIVGKYFYWKGKVLPGVTSIKYKSTAKGVELSLSLENPDSLLLTELRSYGIYARVEK